VGKKDANLIIFFSCPTLSQKEHSFIEKCNFLRLFKAFEKKCLRAGGVKNAPLANILARTLHNKIN
jgi:hypothetical protein